MEAKVCDKCHGTIEIERPNEEDYYVIEITHMSKVGSCVQFKNYSNLEICMDCMRKNLHITTLPEKRGIQVAKSLRQFDQDIESLGYNKVWIIVDKDNFIQAACWSTIYRDSHLRAHPDHIAMPYEKVDKS